VMNEPQPRSPTAAAPVVHRLATEKRGPVVQNMPPAAAEACDRSSQATEPMLSFRWKSKSRIRRQILKVNECCNDLGPNSEK